MYISLEDRGAIFSILKNWPERRVKVRACVSCRPGCVRGCSSNGWDL